jgi:hypothetical protein
MLMDDIYLFGGVVYGSQNVMDPVLEAELKKCKTQKERDEVVKVYQMTLLRGIIAVFVLGVVLCGVIELFVK